MLEITNKISQLISWIVNNKEVLIGGYLAVVGLASWIVKLTPTLKDDDALKGIIKFLGKYVAVNRSSGSGK